MNRTVRLDRFQAFQAINILSDPGAIGGKKVVPQCVEVTLYWVLSDAVIAHNVIHGRYVGVFDMLAADASAFLIALTTGPEWTALRAHLAPTASLSNVALRNISAADQPLLPGAGGGNGAGTSTGTALPDESAVCVTFTTDFAGPAGRGRMYVPGWATTALGPNGTVATAAVTALGNWATTTIGNAFGGLSATHCLALVERQEYIGSTGTLHPAREAQTRDVRARVVKDNHWDNQRRRGLR